MLATSRNIISSDATTQKLLAPVQDTLIAKQRYSIGDLFIFNGGLYEATAVITQNSSIVIGTTSECNAKASDQTIAEKFYKIYNNVFTAISDTSKYTDVVCSSFVRDNICFSYINIRCVSPYTSNWYSVGTFAKGCTQSNDVIYLPPHYGASSNHSLHVNVDANGNLNVYGGGAGNSYRGLIVFPIAGKI